MRCLAFVLTFSIHLGKHKSKNIFAKQKSFENLIECFLRISGSTGTVVSNDLINTAFYVRWGNLT